MKNLVVFYSLGGNTRFIARCIAKELNADIIELKTHKQYPSKGFLKYFVGGADVIFKKKPKLTNRKINIGKYDNIFLGSPVWAGGFATAYNTFIKQYDIANKNLGFFVCHSSDSNSADKCFDKFKDCYPNNRFLGEIDFNEPLRRNPTNAELKVSDWIGILPIKVS